MQVYKTIVQINNKETVCIQCFPFPFSGGCHIFILVQTDTWYSCTTSSPLLTPKLFVIRSQGRSRFLHRLHCVSALCWCEYKVIIEPDVDSDLQKQIKCNKEDRT